MLSSRQELVLRKVVEGYLVAGQPVGSKLLATDDEFQWGPSTIRHELAVLEEFGFLSHPHTSAGRVPTDSGYRYFVDRLLPDSGESLELRSSFDLSLMQREVDDAMRTTVATLSQMTDLLAVVSAPSLDTATIHHVEVLLLQPQVVMVVIITSTGAVSKRVFTFEQSVDRGLVSWAGSYLNEQLVGLGLGARMLLRKLSAPELSTAERNFLDQLTPAFTQLEQTADDTVYLDGASRLLSEDHLGELSQLNDLVELLEHRMNLLTIIRSALSQREFAVKIGRENELPVLQSLAVVSAGYGLPSRTLGAVSVIGPMRMDYAAVIGNVRSAAVELSRFITDVYES